MEVDGAVVHRGVGPLSLDEAEHRAGRLVDDRERLGVARAQRDPPRRVVAPVPDPAGRRLLELRQHRRPRQRLGPERRGVAPRRAAPRTRRRARAGRGCAGWRGRASPPRPRRESSASGSRMKNWSSASSPATSTASPRSAARRAPIAAAARRRSRGSRPRSRSRAGRCRCRAPARPSPKRRAGRPRRAAARSPAAAAACSRPGTERGAARCPRRPARRRNGGSSSARLAALREADRPQPARDERGEQPRRRHRARSRVARALASSERRVPEHDLALGARGACPARRRLRARP